MGRDRQSALAQTPSPASKFSNQGVFAIYDTGSATVFAAGNALSGDSPYAYASFSIVDNFTSETLAFCQSMSPSVSVSPSGLAEVKFSPQVDLLCPATEPIMLTCAPGDDTVIASSTYNVIYRGSGATQHQHNKGWDLYGLRCSIVALGVEYQTTGNAYLMNYLSN
ncbi:MAG: hypothetical protein OEY20_14610 [Gemmatimonadota bacterium]|nr:hypothetical protein [Gemmatimonadota bacterium]